MSRLVTFRGLQTAFLIEKLRGKVTEIEYTPLLKPSDSVLVMRGYANMSKKRKAIVNCGIIGIESRYRECSVMAKTIKAGDINGTIGITGSFAFYTLNRKFSTSPSLTTYSLPSERSRPFSLAALRLPPHSISLS